MQNYGPVDHFWALVLHTVGFQVSLNGMFEDAATIAIASLGGRSSRTSTMGRFRAYIGFSLISSYIGVI